MVKVVGKVRVKNAQGIHARPATAIVKLLQAFSSSVFFTLKKETVNAKSIMSILMLAAAKNAVITVTIEGVDAEEAMIQITKAFENRFGEQL